MNRTVKQRRRGSGGWAVALATALVVLGAVGCGSTSREAPDPASGHPWVWAEWGWTDRAGVFHTLRSDASRDLFRWTTNRRRLPAPAEGLVLTRLHANIELIGDPAHVRSIGLRVGGFSGRRPRDPSFTAFSPHLTPAPHLIAADHTFRSPVVMEARGDEILAVMPDLDRLARARPVPWALRYRPADGYAEVIATPNRRDTHVYYAHDDREPFPLARGKKLELGALVLRGQAREVEESPHGVVASVLWERFRSLRPRPIAAPMAGYVRRAYDWAFERWKDVTWQAFEIDGTKVGGVVFIVTVHQAPGRGDPEKWREKKSIWNQAWFSSLRSAIGAARHARRTENAELAARARLGLAFALAAPQTNGFFPAVFVAGEDGDWKNGEWEWASDRRPPQHAGYCHLTDASWTCDRLLEWHREIEADPRILPYCERYARALLAVQQPSGAFPSWVHPETGFVSPFLRESAQGMTSVMFLHALHEATGKAGYLEAAERCARFVAKKILPESRWEDFETYYSCAREGPFKRLGARDPITGLWPANTLAMWWAAEGFLRLGMLPEARRALDELALYQQVWSPPFLFVPASGGFGVQNTDGEWNDARQSLFCRTFFRAADAFDEPRYRERGALALAASFVMMYCPENPGVRKQYELKWKQLDERDFGFMMENYAHGGFCKADGTGIGPFTIWDWGPGGAAEAFEWALAHGHVKAGD